MGKHFVTGTFPFEKTVKRLPDDVYGQALDRFVISTLDLVVANPKGEIFLGKRAWEPAKNVFWIVGGARNRGESFEETAARNLKRELGVELEPSRFQKLGFYSLAFEKRRQAPEENGTHTDSHVYTVQLTDAEVAALKPNEEYLENMWILPEDIVKRADEFHPAIVQVCKDYLAAKSSS